MKIIFKSAAFTMVAVAQMGLPGYPRAPTGGIGAPTSCEHFDMGSSYCKYQLYGGWDLPVPQPMGSDSEPVIQPEPGCFMGHLPRRGQTGELKRIDCWSNAIGTFVRGSGPTEFTGFLTTIAETVDGLDQKCYLVRNGGLTPVLGSCFEAIQNNDPDRHVVEDIASIKAQYEQLHPKFNYWRDIKNANLYYY